MSRVGKIKRRLRLLRDKDSYHRGTIHAEIMHMRMRRDLSALTGRTGLDVGAGRLVNRPFFRTENYIAVEPRQDSIDAARSRHPDAEIHVSRIEDYEPDRPIDVALAWTVIGNDFFDLVSTVPTVLRITEWIAPDGAFIFDLRPRTLEYEAEIDNIVQKAFQRVDKEYFGRFKVAAPPVVVVNAARALSAIMSNFAPRDREDRSIYYVCRGKSK